MKFDVKIIQSELAVFSKDSDKPLNFIIDFPTWIKGEAGKDFKFEDFTAEQLDDLKLKFSNLTDLEIAKLQQPAVDAIGSIKKVEERVSGREDARERSETGRDSAEKIRVENEDTRKLSESKRIISENERNLTEKLRIENENKRLVAEEKREEGFTTLKDASTKATDSAREVAQHPTYVGKDNYVYQWDSVAKSYVKTEILVRGETAYEYATTKGYVGSEEQFARDMADIVGNSVRLKDVEDKKQDKPIAGRTFLTPLFVARGAVFNDKTGYYELNGLTDITESEMMDIYNYTSNLYSETNIVTCCIGRNTLRTNFPFNNYGSQYNANRLNAVFVDCSSLELVNFIAYHKDTRGYACGQLTNMFINCEKLKKIIGELTLDISNVALCKSSFINCKSLEDVYIKKLKVPISFPDSPLLSMDSILYLINNADNTTPITITLHQEAKARLTTEDIALASSKNITIA